MDINSADIARICRVGGSPNTPDGALRIAINPTAGRFETPAIAAKIVLEQAFAETVRQKQRPRVTAF
jgi:hypothetical protein